MKLSLKFLFLTGITAVIFVGPQAWCLGNVQTQNSCQASASSNTDQICPRPPANIPVPSTTKGQPASSLAIASSSFGTFAQQVQGNINQGQIPKIYGERSVSSIENVSAAPIAGSPNRTPTPQQLIGILKNRIIGNGVDPRTTEEARHILAQMLRTTDPAVLKNLAERKVNLIIVPTYRKITDIFPELKGKTTIDGRIWDNVSGTTASAATLPGDRIGSVVKEETLIPGASVHPPGQTVTHEYSHAIHYVGISQETRDEIKRIYMQSMKRSIKTGLGPYADSNEQEFFAQASADYFGVGFAEPGMPRTAVELQKANPAIYALLEKIYGPQRNIQP